MALTQIKYRRGAAQQPSRPMHSRQFHRGLTCVKAGSASAGQMCVPKFPAHKWTNTMANALVPRKTMTIGEGGSALAFAALAMLSIVVAAKAFTPEYAFHAYLFAAASTAAAFAVVNRYYERPIETPLTVDGKPNYNMAPIKFASVAAVFWGIAGFAVGLYIALELAYPILNFDLPWITFGRL